MLLLSAADREEQIFMAEPSDLRWIRLTEVRPLTATLMSSKQQTQKKRLEKQEFRLNVSE